jgi:peptidoglycan/xylan/chitin deacetylase (PgdA/CDA1 family)
MPKAYLTIDDSPSERTDDLTDFLNVRAIPALLFCRGDRLEENSAPVVRAIEKGMLIGNHTYSHKRASEETLEETKTDILKCERLIEQAYKEAGVQQKHKTFRFSYLDRGTGSWVIDFDRVSPAQREAMEPVFWEGLNFCDLKKPDQEFFDKQTALQEFLKAEGYTAPYKNITLDWYMNTEIAKARDSFFTYSTSDWMLTQRHLTKNWPYKTLQDLERRIDEDPVLNDATGAHIILAHDQAEIYQPVCALVDYFAKRGFEFLDF